MLRLRLDCAVTIGTLGFTRRSGGSSDEILADFMRAGSGHRAGADIRGYRRWGTRGAGGAEQEADQYTVDVRGYIEERRFNAGDLVKQGDILYKLDDRPYKAQVELAMTPNG